MGGELFFAFEESSPGELIGVLAAAIILLVAFGSLVAMGLPIGIALFGLAVGISAMSLVAYVVDIPSWAPQLGSMVGLGVGIDYALFLVTRHRENLALGLDLEESIGRAVATAGQVVSSRAERSSSRSSAWPSRGLLRDGRRHRDRAHRRDHGAGVDLAAAGVPPPGRAVDQPARLPATGAGGDRRGVAALGRTSRADPWGYMLSGTALLLALAAPVLALRMGSPTTARCRSTERAPRLRPRRRGFGAAATGRW